jgi:uncharacterized protein
VRLLQNVTRFEHVEDNLNAESVMEYQTYQDQQGYWRWRLVAGNSRIIADSGEGYYNRQDCLAAIGLVKSSATAPIY